MKHTRTPDVRPTGLTSWQYACLSIACHVGHIGRGERSMFPAVDALERRGYLIKKAYSTYRWWEPTRKGRAEDRLHKRALEVHYAAERP